MVNLDVDYLNYLKGQHPKDPQMKKFYSDVCDLLKLQSDVSMEMQIKNGR